MTEVPNQYNQNIEVNDCTLSLLGEISVRKDESSAMTNRVIQKKKDIVKIQENIVPNSRREKFEMTNMSVHEASSRFRTTERADDENPEDTLCFICYTNEPTAVFLDCGHGGNLIS